MKVYPRAACLLLLLSVRVFVALPAAGADEQDWSSVEVPQVWKKTPAGLGGYSWYRAWVRVPDSWRERELRLFVEPVDDAREVYVNGELVGGSGSFPPRFRSGLGGPDRHRVSQEQVRFGAANLVALRVYNSDGRSGFNVAAPVLFGGEEAIRLQGAWESRAGDDRAWSKPDASRPGADAIFTRVEAAAEVEQTLRQLPGDAGPLAVEEAVDRFSVPEDLVIEAVLSEPAIGQPLDFKFDERGRLWVMNYKQYPNPAGLTAVSRDKYLRTVFDKVPAPPPHHERGADAITIHEDTDGDGVFDSHATFVDGLSIATSFARGRGGLFVLNPPYLLFYADRNQDDVPDGDPEVLLEGFGIEDSHSVANNLRWGPDGWLYAAQGSTVTGQIRQYGTDASPVHSMGQLIWRYHPETRRYEVFAEGGGNAFGVEIDSKGRIFSGHNGGDTRGFHYVQGGYYQKGFGKHGELSNPYSYGYFPPMEHHSVPRFTHAFIIYEGAALPQSYLGRVFGVGPLQSHVISSEMKPRGATFVTRDVGTVLTSEDTWFRPVQIRVGPDGAIYVADFYEQRIDHASHYQGRVTPNTGRIYRLRTPQATAAGVFDYQQLASTELLHLLRHDNKWHRETVQRLLADSRDASLIPPLKELLSNETGQAALEAVWALHASGGLDEAAATLQLTHPDPYVRAWTVRLICDDGRVSQQLADQLAEQSIDEPHIEVRCQLACSARRLPAEQCLPIVANLLARSDGADPFQPQLLWWAVEAHADAGRQVVLRLFEDDSFWALPMVSEHIVQRIMRRYAQAGARMDLLSCARLLDLAPSADDVQRLLAGFEEAYAGRTLAELPEELIAAMARAGGGSLTLRLRRGDEAAMREARRTIEDPEQAAERRAELIQVFGQIEQPQIVPTLLQVARASKNTQLLRSSVFAALQAYDDPEIATHVLAMYGELSAEEREYASSLLASRRTWSRKFLPAVAEGKLAAEDVPASIVHKLLLHDDPQIHAQVESLWPDLNASTSDELRAEVERIRAVIAAGSGNPYSGKVLFSQHCGKCHQLYKEGGRIGPDLTAYKRDDLQRMLLNVVHPSLEIREGFETYVVFMDDGRTLDGFIADQDNRVLMLKSADGQTLLLRRDEIEDMQAVRRSIMPEHILRPLTPQQIRDMFSYLRSTQPLP